MSPIGIEFVNNFVLQHHHSNASGISYGEASQTVQGKIQTALKKLLHFQKTRDAEISSGPAAQRADPNQTPSKTDLKGKSRSVFYTFVLKCVSQILQPSARPGDVLSYYSNENLLRFLRTT